MMPSRIKGEAGPSEGGAASSAHTIDTTTEGCCICHESLFRASLDSQIVVSRGHDPALPLHMFHRGCVKELLRSKPDSSCPLCRTKNVFDDFLVEEDLERRGPEKAYNLLWSYIKDNSATKVKALLDRQPASLETPDPSGKTPLHLAAYWGYTEVVSTLLDLGATVDARTGNGMTPLHLAAVFAHKEIAESLLDLNADINATESQGATPLHSAAAEGHRSIAELLLTRGATVDAQAENGNTPLHNASILGQTETAKLLLHHSANINATALDGTTPLHKATAEGHIVLAQMLRDKGARADATVAACPPESLSKRRRLDDDPKQ